MVTLCCVGLFNLNSLIPSAAAPPSGGPRLLRCWLSPLCSLPAQTKSQGHLPPATSLHRHHHLTPRHNLHFLVCFGPFPPVSHLSPIPFKTQRSQQKQLHCYLLQSRVFVQRAALILRWKTNPGFGRTLCFILVKTVRAKLLWLVWRTNKQKVVDINELNESTNLSLVV